MDGLLELFKDVWLLLWNVNIPTTEFSFGALAVSLLLFDVLMILISHLTSKTYQPDEGGSN